MDDQYRTMYLLDLVQIVKSVEREDRDSGHHPEGACKCAFKNQSGNRAAGCQVGCRTAPHRAPKCNDLGRLDMFGLHQKVVSCIFIVVSMAFSGLALARAVALIVICQDGKSSGPYSLQKRLIVADVFGISVAEENCKGCVWIRQVCCGYLGSIRTREFQNRSVFPISSLLWLKNQLFGEKNRYK